MRVAFVSLALAMAASARPMRRDATALANGQAAIALNNQYKTLTTSSSCTEGEDACVNGKFSQCVNGSFVLQSCAAGTICAAIPLESPSKGTLTTCTTQSDLDTRLAATGATSASASSSSSAASSSSSSAASSSSSTSSSSSSSGSDSSTSSSSSDSSSSSSSSDSSTSSSSSDSSSSSSGDASSSTDSASASSATSSTASNNNAASGTAATSSSDTASVSVSAGSLSTTDIATNATANNPDAQSSLTLNPAVIATGFMQNGQNVQEAGQVASLTSNNNFINYCLTQNVPITNGLQLLQGSCNPAPIGTIPAVSNMPSAKFSNPANGDTIAANTDFTITMNIQNLVTGNFVNADESYFAAPQQVDASSGFIVGHTHVVMELLSDLAQTTPTNPQVFAFFKGVNNAAANGVLNVAVTAGVPAGAYRLCTINSSANHQPVIVPVAQHGALDDCVYFTAS